MLDRYVCGRVERNFDPGADAPRRRVDLMKATPVSRRLVLDRDGTIIVDGASEPTARRRTGTTGKCRRRATSV